jgi:hypothetical protein
VIFTFGFGHSCSCGLSLRECYVEIGGDYDTARAAMIDRYGVKWAFEYDTLADATGEHPIELRRLEPNDECGCGGLGRQPWDPGESPVPPEVMTRIPPERLAEIERLAGAFVAEHLETSAERVDAFAHGVDESAREAFGKPLAILVLGTARTGFTVASPLEQPEVARELRALLARIEAELEGRPPVGKPHTS